MSAAERPKGARPFERRERRVEKSYKRLGTDCDIHRTPPSRVDSEGLQRNAVGRNPTARRIEGESTRGAVSHWISVHCNKLLSMITNCKGRPLSGTGTGTSGRSCKPSVPLAGAQTQGERNAENLVIAVLGTPQRRYLSTTHPRKATRCWALIGGGIGAAIGRSVQRL
jgi:hypothetical protein